MIRKQYISSVAILIILLSMIILLPSICYAQDDDTWVRKTDMPTARVYFGSAMVNGKIYAIGGWNGVSLPTVEEYDPATDKWTRKADMPTARGEFGANALNGIIYTFGGGNRYGLALSVTEAYYTDSGPRVKTISLMKGRESGGESITVLGDRLPPDTEITIGGKSVEITSITSEIITGITPPNTEGDYDMWVNAPGFDIPIYAGKFSYYPPSIVVITKISSNNGKQAGGDIVSITGSGFLPGATVTVGGNQVTNVTVTPTLITFRIPSGTEGIKDVVVTNIDGQKSVLKDGYTYNPFPIINVIVSGYGGPLSGGSKITIKGQNFMQGVVVYVGDERVPKIESFSPNELVILSPRGTEGEKPIRVANPDGQEAVKNNAFSYNLPPNIIGIEPKSGAIEGGTRAIITGTRFSYAVVVYVGGIEADLLFSIMYPEN